MSYRAARLVVSLLAPALMLSGCASVPTSLVRELVTTKKWDLYTANVLESTSGYRIKTATRIHGSEPTPRQPADRDFEVIADGRYRNWTWTVKALPKVAASWRIWRENAHRWMQGHRTKIPVAPVTDWRSGIRRMYETAEFLLNAKPAPLDLEILLIPDSWSYRHSVILGSRNRIPLRLVSGYPASRKTTDQVMRQRWASLWQSLEAAGRLLAHVALERGRLAAPAQSAARALKDAANARCWAYSLGQAFAAGSTKASIPTSGDDFSLALTWMGKAYEEYPDDRQLRQSYATGLVIDRLAQFLKSKDLARQPNGPSLAQINAILTFCRAFVHSNEDVRHARVVPNDTDIAAFFP